MAKLILKHDGINIKSYELDKPVTIIGRSPDCEVHIDDFAISSQHAEIQSKSNPYLEQSTDYTLIDLGSTNGTQVNGEKVENYLLKHGDIIVIGKHEFTFDSGIATEHQRTAIYLSDEDG